MELQWCKVIERISQCNYENQCNYVNNWINSFIICIFIVYSSAICAIIFIKQPKTIIVEVDKQQIIK